MHSCQGKMWGPVSSPHEGHLEMECRLKEPGIKPPTYWLEDDPLQLLSHSWIQTQVKESTMSGPDPKGLSSSQTGF